MTGDKSTRGHKPSATNRKGQIGNEAASGSTGANIEDNNLIANLLIGIQNNDNILTQSTCDGVSLKKKKRENDHQYFKEIVTESL